MLSLGKAIRFVRTTQEQSLSEVAKKAGVGIPFLSLIENGARQPSIESLRKIADALSVPSEALILLAYPSSGLKSESKAVARLTASLAKLAAAEAELKKRLEED